MVVGEEVGCLVGVAVDNTLGVAAGRANSLEAISRRTVKMKPLKKTNTPRIRRYRSFIVDPLPL